MTPTRTAAEQHNNPFDAVLRRLGISHEVMDEATARFMAVPVSKQFNKPRTNLLVRRRSDGNLVFVDEDLVYQGENPGLASTFQGPCNKGWRKLLAPPVPGSFARVLCWAMELLGAPQAEDVRQSLAKYEARSANNSMVLAACSRSVEPIEAAITYHNSFRKPVAAELAVLTMRPVTPRCALLWGESGVGRSHLMTAAAHPLYEAGHVNQVLRVSAAQAAAGCIFPPERDAALAALFRDALTQEETLLLIDDLDVCITGSPISYSLLAKALDDGVRFIATIHNPDFLRELRSTEEGIVRRVHAVHVTAPGPEDIEFALECLANDHGMEVEPQAIQAIIAMTQQLEQTQPAAALGQLGAAIAEATCQGRREVSPDDVLAVSQNQWPE